MDLSVSQKKKKKKTLENWKGLHQVGHIKNKG